MLYMSQLEFYREFKTVIGIIAAHIDFEYKYILHQKSDFRVPDDLLHHH